MGDQDQQPLGNEIEGETTASRLARAIYNLEYGRQALVRREAADYWTAKYYIEMGARQLAGVDKFYDVVTLADHDLISAAQWINRCAQKEFGEVSK